jgi:hypothetical protein
MIDITKNIELERKHMTLLRKIAETEDVLKFYSEYVIYVEKSAKRSGYMSSGRKMFYDMAKLVVKNYEESKNEH